MTNDQPTVDQMLAESLARDLSTSRAFYSLPAATQREVRRRSHELRLREDPEFGRLVLLAEEGECSVEDARRLNTARKHMREADQAVDEALLSWRLNRG